MTPTTTVVITRDTRRRLSDLQAVIRLETGGAVDVDTAINRALDRSEQLARIAAEHPEVFHGQ